MSAQVGDAQLREQDDENGPREEAAEETAAGGLEAVDLTVSDPPQMNGVGGGISEKGAGGAQAPDLGPAPMIFTDGPRGSGAVGTQDPGMARQVRTRTDISNQAASSGGNFAAGTSRDPGLQSALVEEEQMGSFETPRSRRSTGPRSDRQPATWPGWMTRLGDMFKAPAVSWIPSPMPSPPRPRRLLEPRALRGPPGPRATAAGMDSGFSSRVEDFRNTGLGPTLNTPSSSSLPAEAIQAEVQRQLGGLLERLQNAEAVNARLQEELDVARQARVPGPASGNACADGRDQEAKACDRSRDLGGCSLHDPEPHCDPVIVEGGAQEHVGDLSGRGLSGNVPRDAPVEGRVPRGATSTDRTSQEQRSRPDPWRDPLGALWEELQGRRTSSAEVLASTSRTQGPIRPGSEVNLRSSSDPTTTAILEALTKNLTNLQELQAKTMKKEGEADDAPEQVKTNGIVLPPLAGPEGVSAGIVFQDWLAQVAVPMQDLSSSSGIWWGQVLKLVRDTYSKWLAATPLERLQLEPMGHEELTTARWTRVNSRACSLILQCLVATIRLDLIARRAVQSAPLVLFRLHTCYQPGGASERSAVLSNLQNPIQPASLDEALVWLRSWPRWVQRCKDLNMVIPDGTILARTLTAATTKYMSENADNQFRTQLLRSSLRIDGQPAFQDVLKYHQHLQAEAESMISSRTTLLPSSTAVRSLGTPPVTQPQNATVKPPCKYFAKAGGCRRGQRCPFVHD